MRAAGAAVARNRYIEPLRKPGRLAQTMRRASMNLLSKYGNGYYKYLIDVGCGDTKATPRVAEWQHNRGAAGSPRGWTRDTGAYAGGRGCGGPVAGVGVIQSYFDIFVVACAEVVPRPMRRKKQIFLPGPAICVASSPQRGRGHSGALLII